MSASDKADTVKIIARTVVKGQDHVAILASDDGAVPTRLVAVIDLYARAWLSHHPAC